MQTWRHEQRGRLARATTQWENPGMGLPELDLDSLSVDERLRLLERVWESLTRSGPAVPLTAEQQLELDRRLDELDAEDAPEGIPWEDVLQKIRPGR